MSDLDLFADLVTRKLISSDGGVVTLPTFVLGDTLRCTLRTFERSESGDLRERDLRVRTLRASIGRVLAAPLVGGFKLWIGDHDTDLINFDANADAFKAAGQGSGIIDAVENPVTGTWVVKTTRAESGDEWPINVHSNQLSPESFVRLRQFKQLGVWWFECRLIQAPLSFNNGHERVLGAAPTVRRIRTGDGGGETQQPSNEIQALHLPPDFRGTYFLRWNDRVSKLLGIEDGPDEIAAALNAMFEKGKRFEATNPEQDNAYIEFVGELQGSAQPLMTVEVNSFAPGVLTFEMPLDRAQMAAALRAVSEIEVPFEVEFEIVEDGEDAADPAVPGRTITIFQQSVKIVREQIWEELALVQSIDWLRPPQPRDYLPFTPDQIIFGVQHYVAVFGNGGLRSFSFPHNLGTEAFQFCVRENANGGRVLVHGEDFTLKVASANEVLLEVPASMPAPLLNGLAITISTAGPRSAFQAHTHTIAQIVGLVAALAALAARIAALEEFIPGAAPTRDLAEPGTIDIDLPKRTFVLPNRTGAEAPSADDNKATWKPGKLLPAIHDATITPLNALPLPFVIASAGEVFSNNTDGDILLPIRVSKAKPTVAPGGFFGSDGRSWYRLTRRAATNSFFATDLEAVLWQTFVKDRELRVKWRLLVDAELKVRTLVANTPMQARLVIEFGTATSEGAPSPTALNLRDVVWNPTPLLDEQLIIMETPRSVKFGCQITRTGTATFEAVGILYESTTVAGAVPDTANLALRARLIDLDPTDPVARPTGLIHGVSTGALAIDKP